MSEENQGSNESGEQKVTQVHIVDGVPLPEITYSVAMYPYMDAVNKVLADAIISGIVIRMLNPRMISMWAEDIYTMIATKGDVEIKIAAPGEDAAKWLLATKIRETWPELYEKPHAKLHFRLTDAKGPGSPITE